MHASEKNPSSGIPTHSSNTESESFPHTWTWLRIVLHPSTSCQTSSTSASIHPHRPKCPQHSSTLLLTPIQASLAPRWHVVRRITSHRRNAWHRNTALPQNDCTAQEPCVRQHGVRPSRNRDIKSRYYYIAILLYCSILLYPRGAYTRKPGSDHPHQNVKTIAIHVSSGIVTSPRRVHEKNETNRLHIESQTNRDIVRERVFYHTAATRWHQKRNDLTMG